MLHMILLECAMELVPSEISALKQIQKHAARRGKKSIELLLDQSHHGREMTRLEDGLQRGRPDIVFHSLMSILETPLCKSGNLTVHLHLQDGRIIEVNPE
ncbi:MAG: 16S rRNA methyltransferase, partial [Candidatus Thorarchaeota archaeon]